MEDEIVRGPENLPAAIVAVEPINNYNLRVTFSNGRKGIFNVVPYLNSDYFSELKDYKYFRRVHVDYGIVVWPHGQNIAPETIELELQPEFASV
jgi:DUF971 family protein